jgi:ferredoxin-like protein FixX
MGARWKRCIPSWLIAICPAEAFEHQAIIKIKASDSMETRLECTSTAAKN